MAAALTINAPDVLTDKALTWPEQARALTITDQAGLDRAAEMLDAVLALQDEVENSLGKIKKKNFDAWQESSKQYNKAMQPLAEAETIFRKGIAAYQSEQQRLQAERDRVAREEAAALARQQQEAYEAEQRMLREEAERLATEQRIADAVQAEAEGASPDEVTAILETRPFPAVAYVAPPPAPVVYAAPAPTYARPAGISKPRDNWSAEVVDKMALIRFVADHPEWSGLLEVCTAAARDAARVQKQLMNIPGLVARNNPNISVSRR